MGMYWVKAYWKKSMQEIKTTAVPIGLAIVRQSCASICSNLDVPNDAQLRCEGGQAIAQGPGIELFGPRFVDTLCRVFYRRLLCFHTPFCGLLLAGYYCISVSEVLRCDTVGVVQKHGG